MPSAPADSPTAAPQIGVLLTGAAPKKGFAATAAQMGLLDPIPVAQFTLERIRPLKAILIPFGSHHSKVWDVRAPLFEYLRLGGRVFTQADGPMPWIPNAIWEDRPNRNYWWVLHPEMVTSPDIDSGHPAFLAMRGPHSSWHAHGAYTQVPQGARIIQRNPSGEVLTWETRQHGGTLLVSTLDPLPEADPGIQRLSPFDRYCDQIVNWMLDRQPEVKPRFIGKAVNLFAWATVDEAASKGV